MDWLTDWFQVKTESRPSDFEKIYIFYLFERNGEQNFLSISKGLSWCLQAFVETRSTAFHRIFLKALNFSVMLGGLRNYSYFFHLSWCYVKVNPLPCFSLFTVPFYKDEWWPCDFWTPVIGYFRTFFLNRADFFF